MEDNEERLGMVDVIYSDMSTYFKCKNVIKYLKNVAKLNCGCEISPILSLCCECFCSPRFSLAIQEALTYSFFVIERMLRNNDKLKKKHSSAFIDIALDGMVRIVSPKCNDSMVSDRFMICFGDFIWEAIIWQEKSLENFIGVGGPYKIIDTVEVTPYPYLLPWLGILVDIAHSGLAVPHILSWRSKKTGGALYPLLMKLFREEAIQMDVTLSSEGFIGCNTESRQRALATTSHNVRVKVYSLLSIMNTWGDWAQIVTDKIGLDAGKSTLNAFDKVTLIDAENYLSVKLSEIGEYQGPRNEVLGRQYESFKENKIEKDEKEMQTFFEKVRASGLQSSLLAVNELRAVERTTNRKVRLEAKNKLTESLDKAPWPSTCNEKMCHKTVDRKLAITTYLNQELQIFR